MLVNTTSALFCSSPPELIVSDLAAAPLKLNRTVPPLFTMIFELGEAAFKPLMRSSPALMVVSPVYVFTFELPFPARSSHTPAPFLTTLRLLDDPLEIPPTICELDVVAADELTPSR